MAGRTRSLEQLGPALAIAAIAAAALLAYANSLGGAFTSDDYPAIRDNPSIRHLATALFPPFNLTTSGRPVANLSLALNFALGGLNPRGYHAVNIAIHILASLTLFGIVRRTLVGRAVPASRGSAGTPRPTLFAFAVALLWAVHPLQTESVTYVVQRAESLMGLFYLLTLYCFIRYAESKSDETLARSATARSGNRKVFAIILWASLSVISCLLGMGAKEVMVSAPLTVLLYDRAFITGSWAGSFRRHGPLLALLALTWLPLAALVHSTHGRAATAGLGSGVSWFSFVESQFPGILYYLRLAVWPHPLIFDYGMRWIGGTPWLIPSAAAVLALAAASLFAVIRNTAAGLLGFVFFSILAPTSLIPGNRQTISEHRLYLALAPLVILGVAAVWRRAGRAALPICGAVALVWIGLTWRRNEAYHDPITLWSEAARALPNNPFALQNLGDELQRAGRSLDAAAQYEAALRFAPGSAEAENNLGTALDRAGRVSEAEMHYRRAVEAAPKFADARGNLGSVLARLGHTAEAVNEDEIAVGLAPHSPRLRDALGNALILDGKASAAMDEYRAALRLFPEYEPAHYDLGLALGAAGKRQEACAEFEIAARLAPQDPQPRNDLGVQLAQSGNYAGAIPEFLEAIRLKPSYPAAHHNLGLCLLQTGRPKEAAEEFRQALHWQPDYPEAQKGLRAAESRSPP